MARCPYREGTRVVFRPNPAAYMLYDARSPKPGERGFVVTVPVPGGPRRPCMPGPRGGLVYVDWDEAGTDGVFANDVVRAGRWVRRRRQGRGGRWR